MADTTVPTALRVKVWDDNYFTEYIRGNRLARYMGTDTNSVVQVREQLSKKKGESIVFELINRLQAPGKKNNQTLEGFEEDISQRSWELKVASYRHAVVVPEFEEQVTAITLRDAGREILMNWSMEHTRDKFLAALGSKDAVASGAGQNFTNGTGPGSGLGNTATFQTANATALNAWAVENKDRTLYGALVSNYNATFATALLNVDSTADKLSSSAVSVMKRLAKNSNPKIRPIKVNGDEEWYVMFAGSEPFRDLKLDANIIASRQYALERGEGNPLFTDGDIIWDGVIVREIPEMSQNKWLALGASSIDVGEVYLCGAQALGYALAERWSTRTQERDYQEKHGIAVRQVYEVGKIQFGTGATDTTTLKDNGLVTGFFSSVGDA
jgi:N4-gp56 family major capsid protein